MEKKFEEMFSPAFGDKNVRSQNYVQNIKNDSWVSVGWDEGLVSFIDYNQLNFTNNADFY